LHASAHFPEMQRGVFQHAPGGGGDGGGSAGHFAEAQSGDWMRYVAHRMYLADCALDVAGSKQHVDASRSSQKVQSESALHAPWSGAELTASA
jgi:hypothetical protein